MWRELSALVHLTLALPLALSLAALALPAQAQYPGGRQAATVSAGVKPFLASPSPKDLAEEEDRLWEESRDAEKLLRRRGALVIHAEAARLLQDLSLQLYPEFGSAVHASLINDPMLNAFAFPNGGLYFNLGLVARTENISQLACVVGHEGAHFVNRHSYQSRQSLKSAGAFAMTSAMFGVIGALGSLAAVSSVFGYSRELESEADRVGYARLVQAGFAPDECDKVFALMADEARALDLKSSVLFASHPKLTERIDSFRELQRNQAPPEFAFLNQWEPRFQSVVRPLRQMWLDAALSHGQYKVLIHFLERPATDSLMPQHYRYYLGEAYRLRGEPGDSAKAAALHRAVLEGKADYAPSLLGLGMALAAQGEKAEAVSVLKTYIKLSPKSEGALFADKTIQQLEK